MLNLVSVLPKVEAEALSRNYGRFIISPLESGYGVTLGSALRRMLLSSISGAAITSMRINGVYHEFSPIEHIKEDAVQLTLNIKKLRLRSTAEGPVRLYLRAKGEGIVTAADIRCPSEVEIVNPELYIATLDSPEAELEMELVVERGRGYSPAEARGELPIGDIPLDAVFSPVLKVNFLTERERVGQVTNYDRLIMEIWTDGTIAPREALTEAAQLLVRHFSLVAGLEEAELEEVAEMGIPTRAYGVPIEGLGLSVRVFNALRRAGITKVGEVLERLAGGEEALLGIRNFGRKSLDELYERLELHGYHSRKVEKEAAEPQAQPELVPEENVDETSSSRPEA